MQTYIITGAYATQTVCDNGLTYCSLQMFSRERMSNFHVNTSSSSFLTLLSFFSSGRLPSLSDLC